MNTRPQIGERRKFRKFFQTHGHARNANGNEKPIPRFHTAVTTTAWWAQHEVWMPNTAPPILSAIDFQNYRRELHKKASLMRHSVAMKLVKDTPILELAAFQSLGGRSVKIYPEGVTNSNEKGSAWNSFQEMYPAIGRAASLGLIICLHGEQPGEKIDTYERENVFMTEAFSDLVKSFPGVRFNIEHISTRRTLEMVLEMPDCITGGITPQHIWMTRNDVLEWSVAGGNPGINPFHHCRPPVQSFISQQALLTAVLRADEPGYNKLHLGPDSAPHLDPTKLCSCGCPGVFSSPVMGPLMVYIFDQMMRLDHPAFEAFTVTNGARLYGIQPNDDTFELEYVGDNGWEIPSSYGGITPIMAGRKLPWKPTITEALNPELLLREEFEDAASGRI